MKLYLKTNIGAGFLSIFLIIFLSHATAMASPAIMPPRDSGLTIQTFSRNGGSVSSQAGFFFYSDNPEYVCDGNLADNGCWLNKAVVSGNGQIYVWHQNSAYKTITSELNVINPNKENIIVKSNHYGLTNGTTNDTAAWASYLGSGKTDIAILVKPGQTVPLFKQSVAPNNNFGIIAALNITDENGNTARAFLEDIAYYHNVLEVKYAGLDGTSRCRGVGASYQQTITFDPVTMTKNNYIVYSIGSIDDSFKGKDLIKIKDYSNDNETLLAGNYGEVMTITIPIKNHYSGNQNFGIFIGSIGGYSFPFVKLQENSFVSTPLKPFAAYDMIQTGKMGLYTSRTVTFDLVIPSMSSTPLIIGIHPIN